MDYSSLEQGASKMRAVTLVLAIVLAASTAESQYELPELPTYGVNSPSYLGDLSANRYSPTSISNPYSAFGSRYSPSAVTNPYGRYGSKYSPNSATNPYAVDTPRIYSRSGTYLGKLSTNQYDPESISNPYGIYGSKYSPTSVNNKYSKYGSKYSSESATNPYATTPPRVYSSDTLQRARVRQRLITTLNSMSEEQLTRTVRSLTPAQRRALVKLLEE